MRDCIISSILLGFSVQLVALIVFFGAHGTWSLVPFALVGHKDGSNMFTHGPISGEEELLGGLALFSLPYMVATLVSTYCARTASFSRWVATTILSLLGTFLVQVLVQMFSTNTLRTSADAAAVIRVYFEEFIIVFLPQALLLFAGALLLRYLPGHLLQYPHAAR